MHTCRHVWILAYMHMHTHAYTCRHAYMHANVHKHIHIYTYIHTHTYTHNAHVPLGADTHIDIYTYDRHTYKQYHNTHIYIYIYTVPSSARAPPCVDLRAVDLKQNVFCFSLRSRCPRPQDPLEASKRIALFAAFYSPPLARALFSCVLILLSSVGELAS